MNNDNSINKIQTFFRHFEGIDSNGASIIYLDSNSLNGESYIKGNLTLSGDLNTESLEISGTRKDLNWDYAYNYTKGISATLEPTGFTEPENVTVTYSQSNRTITLGGTVKAYYRGTEIPFLSAGYVSPPHSVSPTSNLYLKYNSNGIEWTTSPWDFSELQIAIVPYKSNGIFTFGIREPHGFMQYQNHKEFHDTIGTYRKTGGDISGYTPSSTTLKQPDFSAVEIWDEDCKSIISALTAKRYTQAYLSGGSGDLGLNLSGTHIVPVNGNQPYYNEWTGSVFQQTLLPNNAHMSVWVIAVPTTEDERSKECRLLFLQGQSQGTLADQRAIDTNDINLGIISTLSPEYVFIEQIILQYTAGNWSIIESRRISGTRASQSGSATGIYLTSVSTSGTNILGTGIASNPLYVNPELAITKLNVGGNSNITSIAEIVTGGTNTSLLLSCYSTTASEGSFITGLHSKTTNIGSFSATDDDTKLITIQGQCVSGSTNTTRFIATEMIMRQAGLATAPGGDIEFWTANSGTARTQKMVISGSGNVGLGIVNPLARLHVYATTNKDGIIIDSGASTWSALSLRANGTEFGVMGVALNAGNIITQSLSGDMCIRTVSKNILFSNDSGTNTSVIISNVGKLGIGTIAPSENLHVSGSTNQTFGIASSLGATSIILDGVTGQTQATNIFFRGSTTNRFIIRGDTSLNKLYFLNGTGGSIMTMISGSNNVGVGIDAPTSKLDVNGDIETISGGSYFIGDPTTDGTWKFAISGTDLIFQRRESGVYVTKSTITAS